MLKDPKAMDPSSQSEKEAIITKKISERTLKQQ